MERKADNITLALGEKAPYFSLPAVDGKIYSLSDFVGAPALCVIFTCNHCPYSQAYERRICDLAERYQPLGVGFVAICANDADGYPEDGFEKMVERSKEVGFTFPYLRDEQQVVAHAYDAACTPEVYLFNRELRLAYHGWVDDNHEDVNKVTRHDLRDALDAVLSGETPATQLTPVLGCSIKWKTQRW